MNKTHLGEVDYLRVFGLITIVIIHSLCYFLVIPASPLNHTLQGLALNLLRYGRFIFMFVTGMVFFYSYKDHELNARRFFKRRLKNLVIPYAIWTAIYMCLNRWANMISWPDTAGFFALWWQSLLEGSAFYHLYYILVTIQFYIALPVLLMIFKPRRPRFWAGIILASGLFICIIYHYILEVQGPRLIDLAAGTPWSGFTVWLLQIKDRLLFSYLPFYMLGGLAGIYLEGFRKWVAGHWGLIWAVLLLSLAVVSGEYFYFYHYLGQDWNLTISVFKPSMYVYSIAVVAVLFRLSSAMERRGALRSLINLLAANSLGIYLLHPSVLYFLHNLYQWRPQIFSGFLLIVFDPLTAIVVSCFISLILSSNKYTRFIIGEAGNLRLKQLHWSGLFYGKSARSRAR